MGGSTGGLGHMVGGSSGMAGYWGGQVTTSRATPGTPASLIYKEESLCVCVFVPYRNPHQ